MVSNYQLNLVDRIGGKSDMAARVQYIVQYNVFGCITFMWSENHIGRLHAALVSINKK